ATPGAGVPGRGPVLGGGGGSSTLVMRGPLEWAKWASARPGTAASTSEAAASTSSPRRAGRGARRATGDPATGLANVVMGLTPMPMPRPVTPRVFPGPTLPGPNSMAPAPAQHKKEGTLRLTGGEQSSARPGADPVVLSLE